jgi:hypothetical protein
MIVHHATRCFSLFLVVLLYSSYFIPISLSCPYQSSSANSFINSSAKELFSDQHSYHHSDFVRKFHNLDDSVEDNNIGYSSLFDPLQSMNTYLQAQYSKNQADLLTVQLSQGNLSVIAIDTRLYLFLGGNYSSPHRISPRFDFEATQLKLFSHIALITFILLQPSIATHTTLKQTARHNHLSSENNQIIHISPDNYAQLLHFHNDLRLINGTWTEPERKLTPAQQHRQAFIYTQCLHLVQSLLTNRRIFLKTLQNWAQSLKNSLQQNIYEAAQSQLNQVHRTVLSWKSAFFSAGNSSSKSWENVWAVVLGESAMARKNHIFMLYFSRLLGVKQDSGHRLIYAEANEVQDYGRNLLATHLIDFSIGEFMFHNPAFMHSDILCQSTKIYLEKLLPRPRREQILTITMSRKELILGTLAMVAGSAMIGAAVAYYCLRNRIAVSASLIDKSKCGSRRD